MIIAIGNVGSTSLKSKILDIDEKNRIRLLGEANLDRIKSPGLSNFAHRVGDAPREKEEIEIVGFEAGIRHILDWYVANGVISRPEDIEAMGFKTVMGVTNGANLLTPEILEEMRKFIFVAPVHNAPYIETIAEFRKVIDIPMVGVFEPSFHYSLPEYKRYFGLPWEWHEAGIKRLGFHGASHRYLSVRARQLLGEKAQRMITVHLGGSSSLCAIVDGKSVDISTCFSPNSGVPQGTRPGDVDAAALLYVQKVFGLSPDEVQEHVSLEGGMKGLAGIGTEDMRAIEDAAEAGNHRARMAMDFFIDSVRKTIAGFASTMGGVDAVIFSGGVGENGAEVREKIIANMEFMGLKLDPERNRECNRSEGKISADDSKAEIYIIPTNEEMVVASFAKKVVELGRDLLPEEMIFEMDAD
ncbi:MAG: acetate/propionate family kinase [bacterium]